MFKSIRSRGGFTIMHYGTETRSIGHMTAKSGTYVMTPASVGTDQHLAVAVNEAKLPASAPVKDAVKIIRQAAIAFDKAKPKAKPKDAPTPLAANMKAEAKRTYLTVRDAATASGLTPKEAYYAARDAQQVVFDGGNADAAIAAAKAKLGKPAKGKRKAA